MLYRRLGVRLAQRQVTGLPTGGDGCDRHGHQEQDHRGQPVSPPRCSPSGDATGYASPASWRSRDARLSGPGALRYWACGHSGWGRRSRRESGDTGRRDAGLRARGTASLRGRGRDLVPGRRACEHPSHRSGLAASSGPGSQVPTSREPSRLGIQASGPARSTGARLARQMHSQAYTCSRCRSRSMAAT